MPPAAVFALGLVALAVGVAPIAVAGVTAVAGVYFLVRANAYCYRVYAVSRPLLLQAGTWAAFAVQIAGVLAYVARRRGHDAAVAATADLAGVPASALEPVAFGVGTVPGPILVAALAPGAVVGAYLVVQTLGALLVRLRRPDVDRRSMRSGQRYPPFLDDAPARPVTHRTPSTGTTVSSTGTTASSSGATGASTGTGGPSSGSTASSNDPVTPGTRPAAGDGGTAAGTGSSASDASGRAPAEETPDADAGAGPTPVDADDASATDLDDVSHTRVFSPSSLDDDGAHQPTVECQACGQEVGAGLAECPHCGDDVWP